MATPSPRPTPPRSPAAPARARAPLAPPPSGGQGFALLSMAISLLKVPWRVLRWSQQNPREACFAVLLELALRRWLVPALIGALAPTLARGLFANGLIVAIDRVLATPELILGMFVGLAMAASWTMRARYARAQRAVFEKLSADPGQGKLAHVYFTPNSASSRPSLQEMSDAFTQMATQLPTASKTSDLLKGVPTFSFEVLRSAHYRGGQPQLFMWAPRGAAADPIDIMERALKAGLRAETGVGSLAPLDDECGGDAEKAASLQVRSLLGLASADTSPEEAASTSVAFQRLTVNPEALGHPLVRWDPKKEPDYLSQLLAQMKVGAGEQLADSIGVQIVLRRVHDSHFSHAMRPLLEKLERLSVLPPREVGMPARMLKGTLAAGEVVGEKLRLPNFQVVVNLFATFRGDDPAPALASVEALARHFRDGRNFRFAPVSVVDKDHERDPAGLPVFVPLTPQDDRPIVTSFAKLGHAEMLERARTRMTAVKVRDVRGGGNRVLRVLLGSGAILERGLVLALDRLRLALASGPLAPIFSRSERFVKHDPLAGFAPRSASAPSEPLYPEVSLDELFRQLARPADQDAAAPEASAVPALPDPLADGLSRQEARQLPPEARLAYTTLVARAMPVQLPPFLARPGDPRLSPGIGIVSVDELPMLFHLPKDMKTGLQAKHMPVPEDPRLGFPEKYALDGSRVTFGTGRGPNGEPVYVQVAKETLRSHVHIVSPPRTGKTELLRSIVFQYAKDGHGVLVVEPTGALIESIIRDVYAHLPQRRNDLIYWDLQNTDRPIGINLMERPDNPEQWSDQIEEIIDALNEVGQRGGIREDGGRMIGAYLPSIIQALWRAPQHFENLAALQLFLLDPDFRTQVTMGVDHSNTRVHLEALLTDTPSQLSSKLETAQRRVQRLMGNSRWIRLLAQPKTGFDATRIMADRRLLLVRLSGEQDVLVARFLLAKFYEAMTTRPPDNSAHDFPIFIDEFSKYASRARSVAPLISEARKYSMPIYIVHQTEAQADAGAETDKLREALNNVATQWTFQARDPSGALAFARKTADRVSKQDVQLLPNRRTGYLLTENEVMTVTTLDTSRIGEDQLTSEGTDASNEPTPELPFEEQPPAGRQPLAAPPPDPLADGLLEEEGEALAG